MPPNLVTDVSAALFAAWASNGDEAFSGWLMEALGGDGDGFPRRGTTAAAKADFRDSLLMVNGACGGVDAQGRKMEAGAVAKGIKEGWCSRNSTSGGSNESSRHSAGGRKHTS